MGLGGWGTPGVELERGRPHGFVVRRDTRLKQREGACSQTYLPPLNPLTHQTAAMASSNPNIMVLGRLSVKPEKCEEFEKGFVEVAKRVMHGEPGCRLYQLTKSKTKGDYVVLELYANAGAVKAHKENLKKNFPPSLSSTLAGAPKVDVFQVVVSCNNEEPAQPQHNSQRRRILYVG